MPVELDSELDVLGVARLDDLTAALATANTFENTTAGISGTTAGEYFTVPSANAAEFLALYRNVAGVATDTGKRYPSTYAVPAFKGAVAAAASLSSVVEPGVYYLTPSAGYTDIPSGIDVTKGYNLFVYATVDSSGRWRQQEMCRYDKPEEIWVRRLDTVGAGTTTWYYIPTVRANSIATSNIQALAITNSLIANKAVTRGKLTDEYNYQGSLASGDANTLSTSGTYLVTASISNLPAGAPTSGYLMVNSFNASSFVLQEYISLSSPEIYWRRYIRPANAIYGEWHSLAIPTGSLPLAGKNIVFIGDSITELGDYPSRVGVRLGANATKIGFGGCRMAKHSITAEGLLYDKMCMYNIARYINTGDFSELITAADDLYALNGDDNRPQALALSLIDWSTIDMLVVFFGTNDWAGDVPMGTDSSADGTTFKGAINYTVDKIASAYPELKISFVAPMWRARKVSGDGLDADIYPNTNGDYLIQFTDAVKGVAALNKLPSLDMYRESGVNKYNQATYFTDGLHPVSGIGYQLVADKVAAFLSAKF